MVPHTNNHFFLAVYQMQRSNIKVIPHHHQLPIRARCDTIRYIYARSKADEMTSLV